MVTGASSNTVKLKLANRSAFAHADLFAIVAVERLVNANLFIAYMAQQIFQDGTQFLCL